LVSLTVYDGAYGIGGNKLCIEDKGKGVFLDFGKNFGKYEFSMRSFRKTEISEGLMANVPGPNARTQHRS
jgi:ribonuclease J